MESDEKREAMAAGGAGGVLEKFTSPLTPAFPSSDRAEHELRGDGDQIHQKLVRRSGEASGAAEMEAIDQHQDMEALGAVSSRSPPYSAFSPGKKRYIVFMTAWASLFSSISANIYLPALNSLSEEFHVSREVINLTLTSYMICQGLSPTIFGDLADIAGRRPAYFLGFVIYLAANIGLALQSSYIALFLLRCLQSTGSSATVALGSGVIVDIASSAERGTYMGFALVGLMVGPAIGPVLGGILSQFLGWRSIFWFLVILSVAYLVPFVITFPETGRNVVGNGSVPPLGWNMSVLNYFETRKIENDDVLKRTATRQEKRRAQAELASKRKLRLPNPIRTLLIILEKDVGILLSYNALIYAAYYDVAASLPSSFAEIYGFNDLQIGLSFIPFGAGAAIASVTCGKLMDRNYRRVAKAAGITIDRKRGDNMRGFPIEKARIQVAWPLLYVGLAALLGYGWVLEKKAHLAAPLILLFIVGVCVTGAFNILSVLLIDLHPLSPATATAANNLVRCFVGAAATAVIIQMIDAMGRGWCFTFIAAMIFVTSPMLWVLVEMGPKWREARRVRVEKHKAEKEARRANNFELTRPVFLTEL